MKAIFNNYWFYYRPSINLVNQNNKDFDFIGLEYYKYLYLGFKLYSPQKTRVPAVAIKIIVLGFGFEFYTHNRL